MEQLFYTADVSAQELSGVPFLALGVFGLSAYLALVLLFIPGRPS
jgi:hypothetical protein